MTTIEKIFDLLDSNNMTAKDLSKAVGLSGGNITDWKTGRSNPSISSLQKIADYFHVSIEWLVGNSDKKETFSFKLLEIPDDFKENFLNKLPPRLTYIVKFITYNLLFEMPSSKAISSCIYQDMDDYDIPRNYRDLVHDAIFQLYDYNMMFNKQMRKIQKGILTYEKKENNTNKKISIATKLAELMVTSLKFSNESNKYFIEMRYDGAFNTVQIAFIKKDDHAQIETREVYLEQTGQNKIDELIEYIKNYPKD